MDRRSAGREEQLKMRRWESTSLGHLGEYNKENRRGKDDKNELRNGCGPAVAERVEDRGTQSRDVSVGQIERKKEANEGVRFSR